MCGKGDDGSEKMLQEQKREAAEARKKDEERRARIASAVDKIKGTYKGTEIMTPGTKAYDWSTFKPRPAELASAYTAAEQGIPEGYTYGTKKVTTPGKAGTKSAGKILPNPAGDRSGYTVVDARGVPTQYDTYSQASAAAEAMTGGTGASTTTQKGFYGPDGVFHPEGSAFDIATQTGTGQFTGGFDDTFYKRISDAMTGYYLPQVQDKYKEASDETTYALARAGTLNSSAAIDKVSELLKQKEDQEAKVYNIADTAVGEKKSQIANEMAGLINQAHAVEDPEIAVSSALDRAENITAEAPDLSPLGDIFKVAMIGASKFAEGKQARKVRDALGTQQGGYLVNTA
jgi:hypothetical protein